MCKIFRNPKQSHGEAVRQLGCYLKDTQEKGIIMRPKHNPSYEGWVDANFAVVLTAKYIATKRALELRARGILQNSSTHQLSRSRSTDTNDAYNGWRALAPKRKSSAQDTCASNSSKCSHSSI